MKKKKPSILNSEINKKKTMSSSLSEILKKSQNFKLSLKKMKKTVFLVTGR